MSKKAILSLCIVALLPLVSYLIVKKASENAVVMPTRYFPDSVVNKVVDGKQVSDTIWHKINNVTLVNQLGDTVSLDDISGSIIIADFFFTRCPTICPTLTRNMKELQDAMKMKDARRRIDSGFVRFISFSVDPERDSVEALKKYADKYGVNHDTWWFLTGEKKRIYDFALNELKLGLQDGEGVDSNFIHTQKFVLMDKDRVVRGYYNGLDSTAMSKLAEDLTLLMLEKDRKKKRKIF
ncbi:MAG: SCO family protein [Chitinophagaceae bacterium]|nr:SCO family protein [Chitinophagaceae bacterium]